MIWSPKEALLCFALFGIHRRKRCMRWKWTQYWTLELSFCHAELSSFWGSKIFHVARIYANARKRLRHYVISWYLRLVIVNTVRASSDTFFTPLQTRHKRQKHKHHVDYFCVCVCLSVCLSVEAKLESKECKIYNEIAARCTLNI